MTSSGSFVALFLAQGRLGQENLKIKSNYCCHGGCVPCEPGRVLEHCYDVIRTGFHSLLEKEHCYRLDSSSIRNNKIQ